MVAITGRHHTRHTRSRCEFTMSTSRKPHPHHSHAAPRKRKSNRAVLAITIPLIVLAGGALAALLIADMTELEPVAAVPDRIVSTNETAPEFTPEPYTYDAENNRHWDPGHNHWHDGPPPPIEERTVVAAAPADVEPWFYNEETDQHWDPGHDHWHKGPPPPPEDRDVSIINLEGEPVEPEASQPKPSESQPD